jgi:DNA repair exonuclease SbcCD ATPase subunit
MATNNAASLQKLQYQLKKAETDVEGWKRKEKAKREEFLALQQGVTNKQKQLQQRINRLEQEVLEGKRARDVLQREYQVTLQQVIDLGKTDDKAAPLSQTVTRLSEEIAQLKASLEVSSALGRDWEAKALAAQSAADLARAEKEAAVRVADETEAAAQQLRDVLKEERGAGAGVAGGSGGCGKPLKGKTCVVIGGGEKAKCVRCC